MHAKIRTLKMSDAEKVSDFFIRNASNFKPWSPSYPHGHHNIEVWRERARMYERAQALGESAYFVAILEEQLVAHCFLSQISRGAFHACYMGYRVDKKIEGKGVAYSICKTAIDYAFTELHLHRIMANYMPHNNRSARLLDRLGFVREGIAKNYLKIGGKWQDHVLMSLTNTASAKNAV